MNPGAEAFVNRVISEFYRTTVFPYSASGRSCEKVFGNFLLKKIAHTPVISIHIESLYEFIYNQASQMWGNKMPLCRQHLSTDHFSVSPLSVAVIFLPPSIDPTHH